MDFFIMDFKINGTSSKVYRAFKSGVSPLEPGLETPLVPLADDYARLEECEEITETNPQNFDEIQDLTKKKQTTRTTLSSVNHLSSLNQINLNEEGMMVNEPIPIHQGPSGKSVLQAFLGLLAIITFWVILAHVLPQKDRS